MSTITIPPVGPDDRVNDVLARDERLVDVFVRHSTHFNKLRNRAMRRVMGRLVTVQDAARLASVPVDELLRDLNAALGIGGAPPAPTVRATPRAGGVHPGNAPVVTVDVRNDLREGREPLPRIMVGVSTLLFDEVLEVRAIFEPVPLLALLRRRGFASESVQHGPDDWSVYFWRDHSVAPPLTTSGHATTPARESMPAPGAAHAAAELPARAADDATMWLDVRNLQPPEPLVRTLAALEELPAGRQLVQVNSRVPQLLLPMLAERGFACELDESHTDHVLLRIWRPA